jgi:hypothetical protein
VKNGDSMNTTADIEARLRRILETVPGLVVTRVEAPPATPQDLREGVLPDAMLTLAGCRQPIACVLKANANAAVAWAFVHWASASQGSRPLLVAKETTAEAREILSRHGAAYIDGAGFAHVELPGLFIHVEARGAGRRGRPAAARGTVRLAGRAGVVVQALLLDPRRDWGVHTLAQAAKVSPGLAHKVLQRLETEGIVASSGAGPAKIRRLTDPAALLDLWAEETRDQDVVRTAAFRFARTPRELVWRVAHGLDVNDIGHAVTGLAAAALMTPQGTAVPFTEIWVTEAVEVTEALRTIGADLADRDHNLVVCQARGDLPLAFKTKTPEGLWTVNAARLYLDLRGAPEAGGGISREQANEARSRLLGF